MSFISFIPQTGNYVFLILFLFFHSFRNRKKNWRFQKSFERIIFHYWGIDIQFIFIIMKFGITKKKCQEKNPHESNGLVIAGVYCESKNDSRLFHWKIPCQQLFIHSTTANKMYKKKSREICNRCTQKKLNTTHSHNNSNGNKKSYTII